ncbi:MAG: hypothetical protein HQK97_00920 [Nitrospirae bacterium]|nr:hypothetical protein [Nitrospirota bacterium]
MNKSKERRVKKDLDKLLSSGSYWQWLEKINADDLQEIRNEGIDKQIKDVWQTLTKQALRLPQRLTDFLHKIKGITSYPDMPDVKFLFLLRDFIYEAKDPTQLMALKGLSLSAEELRRRVATWRDEDFPEKKIRKQISKFVESPQKVTKKYFIDLAAQTKELLDEELLPSFKWLSDDIAFFRGLGTKRLTSVNIPRLRDVDRNLSFLSEGLPVALFRVVSYPFVFHAARYLRLLSGGAPEAVAKTVSAIPLLFSLVAGDKAQEVKEKLMHYNPTNLLDHDYIIKIITHGSFEQKISLIGKIRRADIEERKDYRKYEFSLYKAVLSEVIMRSSHISEREKMELPRVLGGAIAHDLHLIFGSANELADLLLLAAEGGCLEIRLAMLSVLVAEDLNNGKLKEYAEHALRNPQKITEEELDWLMSGYGFLVFPRVSQLKPLLDLLKYDIKLIETLADMFFRDLERELFINTALKHKARLPIPLPMPNANLKERKEELRILRKELASLQDYEPFNFIRDYLECYPDGFITANAYRCVLNMKYKRRGVAALIREFVKSNSKKSELDHLKDEMLEVLVFGDVLESQEIIFDMIKDHWEDLKTAAASAIDDLTEIIIRYYYKDSILIRLNNLLQQRCQNGEAEFISIQNRVAEALERLKKAKPKGRRPK